MKRKMIGLLATLSIAAALPAGATAWSGSDSSPFDRTPPFEVWLIDQSRTDANDLDADGNRADGGTVYIFRGRFDGRIRTVPEKIDLAVAAHEAGFAIGQRPHIMGFNTEATHASISFFSPQAPPAVNQGMIQFMRIRDRTVVGSVNDLGQLHMPGPSPDSTQLSGVAIGQGALYIIETDYEDEVFTLASTTPLAGLAGALGYAAGTAVRPICSEYTPDSEHLFITFDFGGLAIFNVEDPAHPFPTEIYTATEVPGSGCSLIQHPDGVRMYTSGVSQVVDQERVFVWNMKTVGDGVKNDLLRSIDLNPTGRGDAHGPMFTRFGRFLWETMRLDNQIKVIDTRTDTIVNTFTVAGGELGLVNPTPDVIDINPRNTLMFVSMRGYCPLSAIVNLVDEAPGRDCPGNQAVQVEQDGRTPGLAIIRIARNGKSGQVVRHIPLSHVVSTDAAGNPLPGGATLDIVDPHGLKVVIRKSFLRHGSEGDDDDHHFDR